MRHLLAIAVLAVIAAACGTGPHPPQQHTFADMAQFECHVTIVHPPETVTPSVAKIWFDEDHHTIPTATGCETLDARLCGRIINTTTGEANDKCQGWFFDPEDGDGGEYTAPAGWIWGETYVDGSYVGNDFACHYHLTDNNDEGSLAVTNGGCGAAVPT